MKRHKHLFEQVCSFENLHAAAVSAMRGKRGKVPAAAFFANIDHEILSSKLARAIGDPRLLDLMNSILNALEHFVKHELRCKGYARQYSSLKWFTWGRALCILRRSNRDKKKS